MKFVLKPGVCPEVLRNATNCHVTCRNSNPGYSEYEAAVVMTTLSDEYSATAQIRVFYLNSFCENGVQATALFTSFE